MPASAVGAPAVCLHQCCCCVRPDTGRAAGLRPRELLVEVLLTAVTGSRQSWGGQVYQQGLRTLASCSAVCWEWRAATEAAAKAAQGSRRTLELSCCETPAIFTSPAVLRWAQHAEELWLDRQGASGVALRQLVERATSLTSAMLWTSLGDDSRRSAVDCALCNDAFATSCSIKELKAYSYVPSAVPTSLERLEIVLTQQQCASTLPESLEVLFARLQYLPNLSEVKLDLEDFERVQLSAAALSQIRLRQLYVLDLSFTVSDSTVLDVSWLVSSSRAFYLDLYVVEDCESYPCRLALL